MLTKIVGCWQVAVAGAARSPAWRYRKYRDGPEIRTFDCNAWLVFNDLASNISRMATVVMNTMRSNSESITLVPTWSRIQQEAVCVCALGKTHLPNSIAGTRPCFPNSYNLQDIEEGMR